jgi:hypothetical protein
VSWALGDATVADRFSAANTSLTSGTSEIGLLHIGQPDPSGQRQTTAASIRITCGSTPSAGVIRVTVFYRLYGAPSS